MELGVDALVEGVADHAQLTRQVLVVWLLRNVAQRLDVYHPEAFQRHPLPWGQQCSDGLVLPVPTLQHHTLHINLLLKVDTC